MVSKLDIALTDIPPGLRDPLIELYEQALSEYSAARWEAVGIKAGKICEVIFSIAHGKISSSYSSRPVKPMNMVADCRKLEEHNRVYGRSLCVQIPRVLIAIYELRNNRNIGHVGGDVDANHMDAEFIIRSVQWLMAELVRIFGEIDVNAAKVLVESITERSLHAVWSDGDERRVLNSALSHSDRVLVLLYSNGNFATIKQLQNWSQYKNITEFRIKILRRLHDCALVNITGEGVKLLPSGVRDVEKRKLLRLEP